MSTLRLGEFASLAQVLSYIESHQATYGFKPHAIELDLSVLEAIEDKVNQYSQLRNTADSIAGITAHIKITKIAGVQILEKKK